MSVRIGGSHTGYETDIDWFVSYTVGPQTGCLGRASLLQRVLCTRTQMQLSCLCVLTYLEHLSYVNETAAAYSEDLMYKSRSEYLLFCL